MAGLSKHSLLLPSRRKFTTTARQLSSESTPLQSSYAIRTPSSSQFSHPSTPIIAKQPATMPRANPLSILPLSAVIRSFVISSISSSPILLGPSLKVMSILANSTSPILAPDRNPLLRAFLKVTFYRQFCAGETPSEVRNTISSLRSTGFHGVFLGYAKEVVLTSSQHASLSSCGTSEAAEKCIKEEILPWKTGTLETVQLTGSQDFVALKFTGAGSQALYDLSKELEPSPALKDAIDEICEAARARGVKLVFDAEQDAVQRGIDKWTMSYMKKYNGNGKGGAVVYGTYQAYLKACPAVLASHLETARKGGFTLGVKLVRGAYLGSDPRELIHDTKADTDACYDGIAEALVHRKYNNILKPTTLSPNEFPSADAVLAGHNHDSVRKVQALRSQQVEKGEEQIELVYAQLQGMADEVSCELVQCGKISEAEKENGKVDVPKAYKYLVWGTTGECMKYLLRRAYENRDAVGRTREGRNEMGRELWRRFRRGMRVGA